MGLTTKITPAICIKCNERVSSSLLSNWNAKSLPKCPQDLIDLNHEATNPKLFLLFGATPKIDRLSLKILNASAVHHSQLNRFVNCLICINISIKKFNELFLIKEANLIIAFLLLDIFCCLHWPSRLVMNFFRYKFKIKIKWPLTEK